MRAEPPASDAAVPPGLAPVRFHVNRAFLFLFIVGLPLLVSLGFWQLSRAAEKEQALRVIEEQKTAPPAPIASVDARETSRLDGRRVLLRGRYQIGRAHV